MVSQSLFCLHRRMFPAMRVKILGLDPHQQYYIAMDIVPVDNKRYRYVLRSFSPPHTAVHWSAAEGRPYRNVITAITFRISGLDVFTFSESPFCPRL